MISRSMKIGYASGQLGITAFEVFIRVQLLIFYTDVVGLSPALAGLAVGLAVFWDAITDPLMGWFSDWSAGRWMRRQAFFVPGALGASFFLMALLSPPESLSQPEKFFYLLLSYLGLNTFSTVFAVPHGALAAEMSRDARERLEIYGWRLGLGNCGAVLAAALPILSISWWGEMNFRYLGFALALALLGSSLVSYFSMRSFRPIIVPRAEVASGIMNILKNRHFLILLVCYLVCTVGVAINSVFALYYYKYRLLLSESQTQKIIAVFIVVFTLSIPLWILISRFVSKKRGLILGVGALGLSGSLVYPWFAPGQTIGPLVYGVCAGVLIASVVLLDSFLADVIDYDELKTKQQRAGLYFGVWKLAEKTTRAVAIFLAGSLLSLIGFVPNQDQPSEVSERIAWIFGPGVNAFFVLGALIALGMTYSEQKHQKVLQLLMKRRIPK